MSSSVFAAPATNYADGLDLPNAEDWEPLPDDDGVVLPATDASDGPSASRDASASSSRADGSLASDARKASRASSRSRSDAATSDADASGARSKQTASAEDGSASESAPATASASAGDASEKQAPTYRDGTYYASGTGKFGPVPVTVVIQDGTITRIDVGANQEAAAMLERARSRVVSEIIETQSTDVETVTGATMTSEAIIDAVSQALERASS